MIASSFIKTFILPNTKKKTQFHLIVGPVIQLPLLWKTYKLKEIDTLTSRFCGVFKYDSYDIL